MKILDSSLFEQPLNFVHQVKEGKHIVLFYEELEYAKMISFQFIKSGLVHKKHCSYLSETDTELVKIDMKDSGIDVNEFAKSGLLQLYQVPGLTDYRIDISPQKERAYTILKNQSKTGETDRIVLQHINKINCEKQIKSNLKWEHDYRFKNLKDTRTTVMCTYPVNDIIPTISDSIGPYGKWMNDLLEIYDGVIFVRRFWKGVAFNLA